MTLVVYFLLTFALAWAAWFTAAALAARGDGEVFTPGGPLFLLGVFAPGLVALALTARRDGRAGLARLVAGIGRWRVGAGWYVFAIGCFAAIELAAALVHRIVTTTWPPFGETRWALMPVAIFASTWVQAGEEIGWRGYALPRLASHLGLGGASILLGGLWALWHLPLFFLPGTGSTGQSFPLYLLQLTALSVVMAWLYWRTGDSLLLVMLMHASVNNTTGIVVATVAGATEPLSLRGSLVAWMTVGLSWALAVPLLVRMRRADLRDDSHAPADRGRAG